MPLSEVQHAHVSKLLRAYCESRVPLHVRDKVRMEFRIHGNAVDLFERRPRWDAPKVWHEENVARFRFVATRKRWWLYCQMRDLKWHRYEPLPEAATFDALLREVDRDPTCIFWG